MHCPPTLGICKLRGCRPGTDELEVLHIVICRLAVPYHRNVYITGTLGRVYGSRALLSQQGGPRIWNVCSASSISHHDSQSLCTG